MVRRGLGGVLGVVGLVTSCRLVAGIDDRKVDPADGAAAEDGAIDGSAGACGEYHYASSACESCMHAHCCDALDACQQNLGCDDHTACVLSCNPGDVACQTSCSWRHQGKYALKAGVAECRAKNCADACGLACGGVEEPTEACGQCVQNRCCAQATKCNGNAECLEYEACLMACVVGSPDCKPACATTYPAGADDATALAACRANSCTNECVPGTAWGCLDSPVPRLEPRVFDPLKYTLHYMDFVTFKPLQGIEAKACDPLDLDCKTPYDTQSTDANGNVTLTVPALTHGFNGFVTLSGATLFPGVFQVWPPVVADSSGATRWPSTQEFTLMAGLLPATVDPAHGHVAGNTFDCVGAFAPGVQLDVEPTDSDSIAFYFVGAVPNAKATATDTQTAIGGVGNVPTGVATVTWKLASNGKQAGQILVPVRAGALTFINLYPVP